MKLTNRSLRKYQTAGLKAIHRAWLEGKRPMISVATGGGKTVMIAQLLVDVMNHGDRAVIIAHTEEIVHQLHSTISKQYGSSVGIGIVMGRRNDYDSRIIVATRQSLNVNRISNILKHGGIDVVVIDEAHHATSENTYADIVELISTNNPNMKLVGFTATPNRRDEQGTGQRGNFFDGIVYSWSIAEGINTGFLVPAVQISGYEPTNFSESRIHWLNHSVNVYEKFIAKRHSCLAFFDSILKSRLFTEELVKRGYRAAHVDGKTPKDERRHVIEAFRRGEIEIVSNMEVLTEGFDAPNASAILLARPTRSLPLFTQIIGRGLRKSPGKEYCLVVNMVRDKDTFSVEEII